MKFLKFYLLILIALKFAHSKSNFEQQINTAGAAISSLIDKLSTQHQMRFHILTVKGDVPANRILNKILSISSSAIRSTKCEYNFTKDFVYVYGISYILISKNALLSKLNKTKRMQHPIPVIRYLTFHEPSILLNYAYEQAFQK